MGSNIQYIPYLLVYTYQPVANGLHINTHVVNTLLRL